MRAWIEETPMSDVHPPAIDEVAPDFTVLDASGSPRRLADLAAERPLVLVFYRGHW
jgi:peroxiredoxin